MPKNLATRSEITINAPVAKVWAALLDPAMIKQYMFDSDVVSDWEEGSPIIWKGQWKGKPYEDKGVILKMEPQRLLQLTHYSPLTGTPDVPESYHTLTYELTELEKGTRLTLTQDNNENQQALEHSQGMWDGMLVTLKKLLEK
jgi:uncharacterized protein YndB with AHSA1/START domain